MAGKKELRVQKCQSKGQLIWHFFTHSLDYLIVGEYDCPSCAHVGDFLLDFYLPCIRFSFQQIDGHLQYVLAICHIVNVECGHVVAQCKWLLHRDRFFLRRCEARLGPQKNDHGREHAHQEIPQEGCRSSQRKWKCPQRSSLKSQLEFLATRGFRGHMRLHLNLIVSNKGKKRWVNH